jgi:hypothetical protein
LAELLKAGDIGVISISRLGEIGGIFTGQSWAVKTASSISLCRDCEILAGWTVPGSADLTAFLGEQSAFEFKQGVSDCALTVANWVLLQTGIDPAANLRSQYSSDTGWRRIVINEGGMVPLFEKLANESGLKKAVI